MSNEFVPKKHEHTPNADRSRDIGKVAIGNGPITNVDPDMMRTVPLPKPALSAAEQRLQKYRKRYGDTVMNGPQTPTQSVDEKYPIGSDGKRDYSSMFGPNK